MSEDKGQQEPSMEDILASIRRILSEDDGKKGGDIAPAAEPAPVKAAPKPPPVEAKPAPPPPPPPPAPEPLPEFEPEPMPEFEPEPEPEPIALLPEDMVMEDEPEDDFEEAEDDVLDLTDAMAFQPPAPKPDPFEDFPPLPPEPEPRPVFEMTPPPEEPEPVSGEALLDRTTQDVSEQAFASLASVLARRNIGVGQLGVTLEELVRELLRPILKAWLDENLPGIVERIVEREVERIVNRLGPMK